MRTKTTLLAILVIVTAIALVTAGSITSSTLAVKKKSTITTKKSAGTKKTKSPKTSTGGSATGATAGTGNSTLGGTRTTRIGTDQFSKFIICMRLFSGPLTRAGIDQCYNIVYGASSASSIIGSPTYAGPTSRAVPKTSNIGPSSNSSTTLGTP
jgi:hypothetical protein